MISAVLLRHGKFLRSTRRRNDLSSQSFADLDGGQAHASSSAQHQQPLSGLKMRTIGQRNMRCAISDRETGSGDKIHFVRNGKNLVCWCYYFFGITAQLAHRHDPIADFDSLNSRSHLGHNTGCFCARRKRQQRFHLVLTGDQQSIQKINFGGMDLNPYPIVTHRRRRKIFQHQLFRPTPFLADDRSHEFSLNPAKSLSDRWSKTYHGDTEARRTRREENKNREQQNQKAKLTAEGAE